MTKCSSCGQEKKLRSRGLCNTCYCREQRHKNPERFRAYGRKRYPHRKHKILAYNKAWREENKQKVYESERKLRSKVDALKTMNPCKDCGNKFPAECMDYDHTDPTMKSSGISILVDRNTVWRTILDEIAKCDLVCANCHRIRTKQRYATKRQIS